MLKRKKIKEESPEQFEQITKGEKTISQVKREMKWEQGMVNKPADDAPEDHDSNGLWNLKICWRKANKKEKAEFLQWVKEPGAK